MISSYYHSVSLLLFRYSPINPISKLQSSDVLLSWYHFLIHLCKMIRRACTILISSGSLGTTYCANVFMAKTKTLELTIKSTTSFVPSMVKITILLEWEQKYLGHQLWASDCTVVSNVQRSHIRVQNLYFSISPSPSHLSMNIIKGMPDPVFTKSRGFWLGGWGREGRIFCRGWLQCEQRLLKSF